MNVTFFKNWKALLILFISIIFSFFLCMHGRIPQPESYFNFADQRTFLGIPHFFDVVSNIGFLGAGIYGLAIFYKGIPTGCFPALRNSYLTFIIGTILVGFGSAFFHLDPNSSTLVWDRLPMTIAFMGFFTSILGEYYKVQFGNKLLFPLLLFGILSVIWWRVTDNNNGGDLRLYFFVQFLPMLLIPIIILVFPSRIKPNSYIWGLLVMYALAKVFEIFDVSIYDALKIVSGHTLKHLAAAFGVYIYARGLTRRKPALETF